MSSNGSIYASSTIESLASKHVATCTESCDCLIECAEELKCNNLIIVTYNEERTIEKKGFRIQVIPVTKL